MLASIISVNAQDLESKFKKVQELSGIEEYLYQPNGMSILLVQDNSAPVVTVQVVYRVGSKHEVTGNTGSTHLLEHLNFKGTPTFNKKKGTAIFTVLQNVGAQMNATTWYDRTNYFETIPSDQIELALHIESDRMRNSLLLKEDKDAEMTVVRNEFERGENNPNSVLNKEIWSTAYMAYPYHHSTIGWRSDIENMPIEVLRKFYNTYYWPDNATLTIIGNFEKSNLFTLVDKYFSKIEKAPVAMPQPYTTEPEQFGPRRVVINKPGQQGVVSVSYKIPGRLEKDFPALTVLSNIIGSGTSSLVNKKFVDTGVALYGYSSATNYQEVNLFSVNLGFTADKKHEEMNAKILELIEDVKKNGVSQVDIDRIVSKLNSETILSRDGSGSIAGELTEAIAGGDWKDYINGSKRLSEVTVEDVNRVAKTYLIENQSTTGYFVPVQQGGSSAKENGAAKFVDSDSKVFFRDPKMSDENSIENASSLNSIAEIQSAYETIEASSKGEKFIRKEVAGIDVVSVKTGAKDFVTINASFPIADYFKDGSNQQVPDLMTQLLNSGTTKNNKFAFSEKLEKIGVSLDVSSDKSKINISFKCLKNNVNQAISLLAEELRYPLFDAKEFKLLKDQNISGLKQQQNDPGKQGFIALMQAMYPKENPNYKQDVDMSVSDLENMTIEDLKAFHKKYFGTKGMHLVAVGDVDTKALYTALNASFKGWSGGIDILPKAIEPVKVDAITKTVFIPQKPSAELFIGQYTGVKRNDKEFIPLYVGTSILGGGFSGRLMMTVRDNDGLTYNIASRLAGFDSTGGYWFVNGSFNPSLFEKGLDATMVQVQKWSKDGVTEEELLAKKSNLIGSFKVGLATTAGLAGTILAALERGYTPDYIDQYPKEIQNVTLEEVNQSIKKYIDLNKFIVIKSGSLESKN